MNESPLHAPSEVRALLDRFGLRASKSFGQNFLVDGNILSAIVALGEPGPGDTVLEVGPGLGVLTRALSHSAGRVVAVELDEKLLPVLEETVGTLSNVELIHGDAMQFDLQRLPAGSLLVANLPYNVATGLIIRALESGVFARLVVMVQREVADRLTASPGSDAFGALSLIAQNFADVRIDRLVSPASFFPPPEVTSALVRLEVREEAEPRPELFRLIRDAFRHRRKTLAKNLRMAGYDPALVTQALSGAGLDPRVRGEELGLDDYGRLLVRLR